MKHTPADRWSLTRRKAGLGRSESPPGTPEPAEVAAKTDRTFLQWSLFAFNILATLLLVGLLLLLYVWPEQRSQFHLTEHTAHLLTLNLISVLLFSAWLQGSMSGAWRVLTLAAAFIVMAESCLVGLSLL